MSVDFRLINGCDGEEIKAALEMMPKDVYETWRKIWPPRSKSVHIHPYCPKPNEPDGAIWVKREV